MGNFAEELMKGKKFIRKGQHWWGVGNPKGKHKPVKLFRVFVTVTDEYVVEAKDKKSAERIATSDEKPIRSVSSEIRYKVRRAYRHRK